MRQHFKGFCLSSSQTQDHRPQGGNPEMRQHFKGFCLSSSQTQDHRPQGGNPQMRQHFKGFCLSSSQTRITDRREVIQSYHAAQKIKLPRRRFIYQSAFPQIATTSDLSHLNL